MYAKRVRETSNMGNNHPDIYKFNKFCKIDPRSPYCSSSGIYAAAMAGMKFPNVTPRAYSWRQNGKMVFYPAMLKGNSRRKPDIKEMDAITMNFSHVEFAARDPKTGEIFTDKGIYTVGCNTRGGLKRIEGCYYPIFRPWSLVHSIYNHISPWYNTNILN